MKMGSNIKEFRFHEGCLDHKWTSSYRKLWLVMKRNIIYIFRDRPYIPENHEGTLTVDKTTIFEVRAEKPNNYKFILYTNNRGRINTFKSDKKSERDLWRGYIVGVARQKVPDDLDLPRDIINRIKQDVANFHLVNGSPEQFDVVSRTSIDNRSSTSNVSTISPQQSVSSGRSNPNRHSVMSGDSGVSVSVSQRSPSSGSGSMTIGGIGGGPFMRHKFTNSPEDSIAPSWFFEACTREKAESYLAIAAENKFGDTLMRESTKFKQDGSYVISKRIVRQGRSSVEHYEVIRVDRGYKIKVENQHDAMRNLTDVMNYFVRTSGSYGTTPLSTNRLSDFGMTEDPYNTGRIQLEDTVAAVLAEPVPDYEEPIQTKQQVLYQRHKTVTPNSRSATFNFHQARYSYNTERHAKNYIQQPGKPSIDEIQTNIKAAATLHMLDKTIDPFDEPAREEDYINLKDLMRQEDDVHVPSLPPPPVPHAPLPEPPPVLPLRNQSYVNKEPQPAFQAPVPPPAPAKLERPKSVPNFADHLKSVQLNPVLDKKAVTNQPPPVQHRLSQPVMKDNNRDGVPTPQQLGLKKTNFQKADPSKGEIMRPTGNPSLAKTKSLDIPSSHVSDVPSPQQMGLRLTKTKRESISEPDQQEVDKAPEIDQSNPGGVSSIKSMFERKPCESDDKQLSPRQQTGDGSLPVTYNPPPMCGNPNPQDHLYVNNPIHVDNESPYTDARTPKPGPCGRLRSKSTPTISPEIREQLRVSKMSTGNSTFIQQLENLVGGQQSKIPLIPRRHSQQPEADDNYEYLPF